LVGGKGVFFQRLDGIEKLKETNVFKRGPKKRKEGGTKALQPTDKGKHRGGGKKG